MVWLKPIMGNKLNEFIRVWKHANRYNYFFEFKEKPGQSVPVINVKSTTFYMGCVNDNRAQPTGFCLLRHLFGLKP